MQTAARNKINQEQLYTKIKMRLIQRKLKKRNQYLRMIKNIMKKMMKTNLIF